MILDIYNIYIEYLDQVNKAKRKFNKICTCVLRLKYKLHISNNERR